MFTLILPALLRPDAEHLPDLAVPALNGLMRLGEFHFQAASLTELYTRHLCGAPALPDNCVYASPLSHQIGMHSVTLADGHCLTLNAGEAAALCKGLNDFYRQDARFTPLRPDLWQVQLPQPVQWQAPAVFEVLGQMHGGIRAEGAGAGQWLQLQTEIQMWLHSHPMNRHRQENGLPPVNGIWLWNPPPAAPAPTAALIGSNSPWAAQSPCPVAAAPPHFAAWQNVCAERHLNVADTVLFLDDLMPVLCNGDLCAYRRTLEQWDECFFAPLGHALKTRKLEGIKLITDGINGGTLTVRPPTFWSFLAAKRHFSGKNL